MKLLKFKIKLVAVLIIILLVLSNLFILNVTAELKPIPDGDLYFDDFSNENGIYTKNSCIYNYNENRSYFSLEQGAPIYTYNYRNKPDNIGMWGTNWSFLLNETLLGALNKFLKPDYFLMEDEISNSVKSVKLTAVDNKTISTVSSYLKFKEFTQYPVHRFHVKIDQDVSNIEKLTIRWWFGNYQDVGNFKNLKEIRMYIWSYGTILPRWINPSDLNILYSEATIGKEYDGEKLADITYIDDGRYISEDGDLDFLVIGQPFDDHEQFELLTDYIDISIETAYGYESEGYLISDIIEIEPSNFTGWESVIWSSSRYSNRSGITISILDQYSREIAGYSGISSPLDISGIKNNKIRLKATLHSNDPQVTPKIFNWGVLYKKGERFIDSFIYGYKIDAMLGTEIENGSIVVSNYFGQWPFFGRNSDNTRFYQGSNIYKTDAELYWYSDEDYIAGGFRSPVTSEGKIYVASVDRKIYAYNILKNPYEDAQNYIDISTELSSNVESSLGIYKEYLIAATGEPGGKNKIYALNKNNLSEQPLWYYPKNNNTICFSSNPTIDEDRLFITSWGGNIWDTAYFSSISRLLGGNNKIIAIDINTGVELWNVTLPTGSISSPAVGNGFVYVGCQNMSGSSLFAFDTETADEIWHADIGIIGRSSPVYADEKVFVLSNKKQNISSIGTYMLTAVNANNGRTIWNRSLGDFKTSSLINILKGLNFTYKILEGFAPISSPAYKDGTLFVLSPNGTFLAIDTNNNGLIKWKYNITDPIVDLSYYLTSPVVVGDMVYIISGDSVLYAFKTEYSSNAVVEPTWTMEIGIPGYGHYESLYKPDILASPIISDNIIIISGTYNTYNLSGRLLCIGDYIQNYEGTIKSTNIYLPTGKWWNKFNANLSSGNINKVEFKILDKNDKELTNEWFSITDGGYNLSDINCNVIKLYAKLLNPDKNQDRAILNSWTVNWSDEKAKPIFNDTSFKPGLEGWISSNLTEFSIEVEDKADNNIISGLDIDSAKYRITYIENITNTKKLSDWLQATSSVVSGENKARIIANLREHGLNVKSYVNVQFTIKDLAGNQADSNIIYFRIDITKPSSEILNKEDFEVSYNTLVSVKAKANDLGTTGNISGIRNVSLIYQYSEDNSAGSWNDWQYYGDDLILDNYSWEFGKNLKSGYYKILTIAFDKADNKEDININKIIQFFFDNIDPIIKNDFNSEYRSIIIPSFNLELYDDYSLNSLYYKIDEENYIKVVFNLTDDIKSKQDVSVNWNLPDDKWASFKENEEHYIYFKLEDMAGNYIETPSSNTPKVIKDENISQLYVDLSDFSTLKLGDTYIVKVNIPEDIDLDTAQLFYQYSDDNSNWSIVKQVGNDIALPPFEWSFTASNGSGYYKFYAKIIDISGAEYTSDSEIINVTIIPTIIIALVVIAIIFILFSLLVYRKMKKDDYI